MVGQGGGRRDGGEERLTERRDGIGALKRREKKRGKKRRETGVPSRVEGERHALRGVERKNRSQKREERNASFRRYSSGSRAVCFLLTLSASAWKTAERERHSSDTGLEIPEFLFCGSVSPFSSVSSEAAVEMRSQRREVTEGTERRTRRRCMQRRIQRDRGARRRRPREDSGNGVERDRRWRRNRQGRRGRKHEARQRRTRKTETKQAHSGTTALGMATMERRGAGKPARASLP